MLDNFMLLPTQSPASVRKAAARDRVAFHDAASWLVALAVAGAMFTMILPAVCASPADHAHNDMRAARSHGDGGGGAAAHRVPTPEPTGWTRPSLWTQALDANDPPQNDARSHLSDARVLRTTAGGVRGGAAAPHSNTMLPPARFAPPAQDPRHLREAQAELEALTRQAEGSVCFRSALDAMRATCGNMTTHDKRLLAARLANCHLAASGRPHYDSICGGASEPSHGIGAAPIPRALEAGAAERAHHGILSTPIEATTTAAAPTTRSEHHIQFTAGQEPSPAQLRACTATMDDAAFAVFTEFFTHVDSVCHYIAADLWQSRTDALITGLYVSAQDMTRKLIENYKAQDVLLQNQEESLANEAALITGMRAAQSRLHDYSASVDRSMAAITGSIDDGYARLQPVLDDIRGYGEMVLWLHSTSAADYRLVKAAALYACAAGVVWVMTAWRRARASRFVLLAMLLACVTAEAAMAHTWASDLVHHHSSDAHHEPVSATASPSSSSPAHSTLEAAAAHEALDAAIGLLRRVAALACAVVWARTAWVYVDIGSANHAMLLAMSSHVAAIAASMGLGPGAAHSPTGAPTSRVRAYYDVPAEQRDAGDVIYAHDVDRGVNPVDECDPGSGLAALAIQDGTLIGSTDATTGANAIASAGGSPQRRRRATSPKTRPRERGDGWVNADSATSDDDPDDSDFGAGNGHGDVSDVASASASASDGDGDGDGDGGGSSAGDQDEASLPDVSDSEIDDIAAEAEAFVSASAAGRNKGAAAAAMAPARVRRLRSASGAAVA